MPYPNEYACRLLPKKDIITCRSMDRESATYGKKYRAIICQFRNVKLGASKWYIQSLRFPAENWTEAQARTICSRYEGDFEPLAKPEPKRKMEVEGQFVRKRQVLRAENGSSILIKTEPNPEYPIIRGENSKKTEQSLEYPIFNQGRGLEDFEYLLHHIHIEAGKEETHHCYLTDHIGNIFELDHIGKDGKVYHIIKGLEPTQEVAWTDQEAKEEGIEPKDLKAGLSLEEKARKW